MLVALDQRIGRGAGNHVLVLDLAVGNLVRVYSRKSHYEISSTDTTTSAADA